MRKTIIGITTVSSEYIDCTNVIKMCNGKNSLVFCRVHIPKLITVLQSFLNEKPTKKADKANYLKARVK